MARVAAAKKIEKKVARSNVAAEFGEPHHPHEDQQSGDGEKRRQQFGFRVDF